MGNTLHLGVPHTINQSWPPRTQKPSVVPRSNRSAAANQTPRSCGPTQPLHQPCSCRTTTHDFYKNQPSFISPLRSAASSTFIASPQASRILCASAVRCRAICTAHGRGSTAAGALLLREPIFTMALMVTFSRMKRWKGTSGVYCRC